MTEASESVESAFDNSMMFTKSFLLDENNRDLSAFLTLLTRQLNCIDHSIMMISIFDGSNDPCEIILLNK